MTESFDREIDSEEPESIAGLAQHIVYRVPGCTDMMIRQFLQESYHEFARLSGCFTSLVELDVAGGPIPVSGRYAGMYVDSVAEARSNGRLLRRGGDYVLVNGRPPLFRLEEFCRGRNVGQSSREPRSVTLKCVEIPKTGSEQAPRWFLQKYGVAVSSGALVRLFGMSGKPWSDAAQAQHEMLRYENYLTGAKVDALSDDGAQFGGKSFSCVSCEELL